MFCFLMHPGLFGQFFLVIFAVLFPEPVIFLQRFLQQTLGSVFFVCRNSRTGDIVLQVAVDKEQRFGNGMELPGLAMEPTDQFFPLHKGTEAPAAFMINQDFPQTGRKGKQPGFQRVGDQKIIPLYLTLEPKRMAQAIHMLFVFFVKSHWALVWMAPFAGPVSLCQGFLFCIEISCMIFLDAAAKRALLQMVYFTGYPFLLTVNQHLFHLFSSPVSSITKEMGGFGDRMSFIVLDARCSRICL
ncbi:hypothetical protein [Acidaminococcus fermentans]|uniref:hypothetical protein n=1 Tax=Acidaminococcus fermentans TaxID=905 RepID=UPI002433329B|nr:hypothetical protein [Acidaminococcus fermentans]